MSYTNQTQWKEIMEALPKEYHFTKNYKPAEEWWNWKEHNIHLDTFRNPKAKAKIIMFHGVGTNGRQISLIAGGPQSKNGYETIMIDMPTYGMTVAHDRNRVTYDDWVQIGSDYIDYELRRDNRPIFLYGLSAGGMETYHVAALNKKVKGIIGMTFLDQRNAQVKRETASSPLLGQTAVPTFQFASKLGLGTLTLPMTMASKMSGLVNDEQLLKNVFYTDKTSAGNKASINFLKSYMTYVPAIEPKDFDIAPILLTQPDADRWTPLHLSKPVLDKITKVPVDIVLLPQGGHYPIEKQALAVMNESIHKFVSSILNEK